MGFGGISIWQLLIILVIVVMVFGTKKLRNMGGDLGTAIKGFKKSVKEEPASTNKIEGVGADDVEESSPSDVSDSKASDKPSGGE